MKFPEDEKHAQDDGFLRWIVALEAVMLQHEKTHGWMPYALPLAESTGLDCWRGYYDDEYSPESAFSEDLSEFAT